MKIKIKGNITFILTLVFVLLITSYSKITAATVSYKSDWRYNNEVGPYSPGGGLVRSVQQIVHTAGYYPGSHDGWYGSMTASAIKSYQSRYGLYSDGIVGWNTWGKIQEQRFNDFPDPYWNYYYVRNVNNDNSVDFKYDPHNQEWFYFDTEYGSWIYIE